VKQSRIREFVPPLAVLGIKKINQKEFSDSDLCTEDIAQQLDAIQLGKYAHGFIAQEITSDPFTVLTNDDCRELGLTIGARIAYTSGCKALFPSIAAKENEDEAPIRPRLWRVLRRNDVKAVPEDSGARIQCRFCRRYFH
jgi:hypothetical protein